MPGPYTQGAQSAEALGEDFVAGKVRAVTVAVAATSVAATLSAADQAGTAFTPDFVLFSSRDDSSGTFTVTISGTTTGLVTFTRSTSTAATTLDVIYGDLE